MAESTHFNLGTHTKAISTPSKDPQDWFNTGLNWCYGFDQEEGVAYAAGPFYNNTWRQHSLGEARARRTPSSGSGK